MEAFKTRHLSSLLSGQRETTIWTLGVAFLLSMLLGDYIHRVAEIESTALLFANGILIFILLIYLDKNYRMENIFLWKSIPISTIPIFIAYFSFWNERSFGGFDFGAILFHYQAGFGSFVEPVIQKRAIRYTIFAMALVVSIYYFNIRIRKFRLFDIALAATVFYFTPISGMAWGFIKYSIEKAPLSAEYRLTGVGDLTSHGANKNLIIIYAESAERTFQELDVGPDIFRDLIQVASRGIEVKGIRQVANTGWSVAGLVASQCGIPLQQHKSFYRNIFADGDQFLGNAQCLGDLLENHLYKLVYMSGADLSFAGMDKFLYQHGYSNVYDIRDTEYIYKEYPNSWGLYDNSLFEMAGKKLEALSSGPDPFVLSIATIGGHFPDGVPTKECIERFGPIQMEAILFSMKCMGFHIRQFIDESQRKGLLENTIVVVMSDHLIMKNGATEKLNQHNRLNFFTASGDGIGQAEITKTSTMFDVFPTLLELAGFEIPERRAGLGVSLLSEHPSLVEKLGEEALNNMINYDRDLGAYLWGDIAHLPIESLR